MNSLISPSADHLGFDRTVEVPKSRSYSFNLIMVYYPLYSSLSYSQSPDTWTFHILPTQVSSSPHHQTMESERTAGAHGFYYDV
jgi:hypothetical protein